MLNWSLLLSGTSSWKNVQAKNSAYGNIFNLFIFENNILYHIKKFEKYFLKTWICKNYYIAFRSGFSEVFKRNLKGKFIKLNILKEINIWLTLALTIISLGYKVVFTYKVFLLAMEYEIWICFIAICSILFQLYFYERKHYLFLYCLIIELLLSSGYLLPHWIGRWFQKPFVTKILRIPKNFFPYIEIRSVLRLLISFCNARFLSEIYIK